MKVCGFSSSTGLGQSTQMEGVVREPMAAGQRLWVVKHAHRVLTSSEPFERSHEDNPDFSHG